MRANRLDHLVTLTYRRAPASSSDVRADLRAFFRRMQRHGGRTPLATVIERGERGTQRFHCHLALRGYFPHGELERLWANGKPWITGPRDFRAQRGCVGVASYLSKYLSKAGDAEQLERGVWAPGENRWFHTQGFAPVEFRAELVRPARALAFVERSFGQADRLFAYGGEPDDPIKGWWGTCPERTWWAPPRVAIASGRPCAAPHP